MNAPTYQTFDMLQRHKAQLRHHARLSDGTQLAHWFNSGDRVTNLSNHHTLSLYIADGYDTWHKTPNGWRNGGGPDRFCLMPAGVESTWDLRSDLSFVHLYCSEAHLRQLAEETWDRSPAHLQLHEKVFASDDRITQLYRHFLLSCDWQQPANQLMLSSASTLLLTHLLQRYSDVRWRAPQTRGGLAPAVLRRLLAFIDAHLDRPLTLAQLSHAASHAASATDAGGRLAFADYHCSQLWVPFAQSFQQSFQADPWRFAFGLPQRPARRIRWRPAKSIPEGDKQSVKAPEIPERYKRFYLSPVSGSINKYRH